ncbi:hypothetical protein L1987_58884 [Smallanthus sonchifolius]|uniref:Uncharacterized protein n=1 Tax=Smallanthus sonchifolius TaxID=185202 RepID=A0ACB9D3R7_9ASTR|nr:hypothetical protein L1987_58884 [Smallanthus sonchifolius]
MSTGDFLNLYPSELKFPIELKKQSSCSLHLTNKTDQYIAYMFETATPKICCMSLNTGILLPRSVSKVTFTMQAPKEAPPEMQMEDKFLLQAVVAPNGATTKDITADMFNNGENKVVEEFKVRVVFVYIPANPPSPVPKDSEEGSSPRAEDGSQSSSGPDFATRSMQPKEKLSKEMALDCNFGEFTVMSTGDFLNLHPSELKFPFELKKQSSCSLQLTNKTDQYIAFKFKTTNPKKYCVPLNTGIVLPRSVCDVTVTMQALKKAPSDMQCKDKFLLQAVVAPDGATTKDITADMFNNEENKVVEEFKLGVVYIPANPPSPVPKESEEGSSPRAEDGSHSSSGPDFATRSMHPKEKLSEEPSLLSKSFDEMVEAVKQMEKLQQELELLRKEAGKSRSGDYSILFLVLIGIIGFVVGYLIKQT